MSGMTQSGTSWSKFSYPYPTDRPVEPELEAPTDEDNTVVVELDDQPVAVVDVCAAFVCDVVVSVAATEAELTLLR